MSITADGYQTQQISLNSTDFITIMPIQFVPLNSTNITTNTTVTNYTVMFTVVDDMKMPVSGITAVVNQNTASNYPSTPIPVVNGSFVVNTQLPIIVVQFMYNNLTFYSATFYSSVAN
jgi:hypothetical protein